MDCKYPLITVNRHRINQDGDGVFTLVAGANCPLSCVYCLNKELLARGEYRLVTPEELFDKVKVDNLYFLATNGGITFGGGEPLLYPDFIRAFAKLVDGTWRINVETSLHVPAENLSKVFGLVDRYIVDVKDCNSAVYRKYTGKDNRPVMENLKALYEAEGKNKVLVRVPWIEGFNTQEDVRESVRILKEIGFDNLDCFRYLLPQEQEKIRRETI